MIKYTKLAILLLFLHANVTQAGGFGPTFGLYLDSYTGLSVRGGAFYVFNSLAEESDSSVALYSDVEFGTRASKVTIGPAYATGITFTRIGFSFGKKDSQDYVGIEALHSAIILSFKFGIYQEPDSDEKFATIGIGIGL